MDRELAELLAGMAEIAVRDADEATDAIAPRRRPGLPRTEYQLRTRLASGARVRVVVHVSPYSGALETDHSAVALVEPARPLTARAQIGSQDW